MIMNYNYFKDKNLGIAMERLAELASVSLGEELAGRHVRVCVRVFNVFPPGFWQLLGLRYVLATRLLASETCNCPPECVEERRRAMVVHAPVHGCHSLLALHLPHL